MAGSKSSRGLYQKGRLIDSDKGISFPALPDMWREMQRCYHGNNDYYLYTFNIYIRIKYFKGLCDIHKEGM